MQHFMIFFSEIDVEPYGRIALKFCIAFGESFAQLLAKILTGSGQGLRSQSYDVIKGTASDRFFKEIVFSTT